MILGLAFASLILIQIFLTQNKQGDENFPESIINSEKYSRLFDANERNFLISCL